MSTGFRLNKTQKKQLSVYFCNYSYHDVVWFLAYFWNIMITIYILSVKTLFNLGTNPLKEYILKVAKEAFQSEIKM